MSKFESTIKQLNYPQQVVFEKMSDLRNLEKVRHKVPQDKVKDFDFGEDWVSLSVAPVGSIKLKIVERDEPKCIKFETERSIFPFTFWVQLLPLTEETCKMKLTLKAELNPFIKKLVEKPIESGLEKVADAITLIRF